MFFSAAFHSVIYICSCLFLLKFAEHLLELSRLHLLLATSIVAAILSSMIVSAYNRRLVFLVPAPLVILSISLFDGASLFDSTIPALIFPLAVIFSSLISLFIVLLTAKPLALLSSLFTRTWLWVSIFSFVFFVFTYSHLLDLLSLVVTSDSIFNNASILISGDDWASGRLILLSSNYYKSFLVLVCGITPAMLVSQWDNLLLLGRLANRSSVSTLRHNMIGISLFNSIGAVLAMLPLCVSPLNTGFSCRDVLAKGTSKIAWKSLCLYGAAFAIALFFASYISVLGWLPQSVEIVFQHLPFLYLLFYFWLRYTFASQF